MSGARQGYRLRWWVAGPDGTEVETGGIVWSDGPATGQVWAVADGDRPHFTLVSVPTWRAGQSGAQRRAIGRQPLHPDALCQSCADWLAGQAALARQRKPTWGRGGRRG